MVVGVLGVRARGATHERSERGAPSELDAVRQVCALAIERANDAVNHASERGVGVSFDDGTNPMMERGDVERGRFG